MELPPNRSRAPRATWKKLVKPLFTVRKRTKKNTPLDKRFYCCANCRHYVSPHNIMMLDGPPSSYCKQPQRVGSRYIGDESDVAKIGLFRGLAMGVMICLRVTHGCSLMSGTIPSAFGCGKIIYPVKLKNCLPVSHD